jgi:signal transduction histidine kinase
MTVLVLLWLFQVVFLGSFYTNMHVSDIKKEALTVIKSFNGNKTAFASALDTYAYANNLNLEWIDVTGDTIYAINSMGTGTGIGNSMGMGIGMSMGGKGNMGMNIPRTEIVQNALSGKTTSTTVTNPRFGNEVMFIGIPVYNADNISSVLIINFSLTPVEDTVSILKRQLIIITGILLAASLLLSFIMSRRFTKPILEIKKVSENMAQGDFASRINIKRRDEIGELAQTINNMGQQLSQIEQLRKDLIANVSHELRTPLSLIQGYAETIRDVSGNTPEKREKQLGIFIEETQRLSRFVDDILKSFSAAGWLLPAAEKSFL